MSVIDDLKSQIAKKRIIFDKPALQDELLGSSVAVEAQKLVHHLSTLETLRISSIVRAEGHHAEGRAFDVGNEDIAKRLLATVATNDQVKAWMIDEIIFDAKKADASYDRNKWNYDRGAKHVYDAATLNAHGDHIHFAVKVPAKSRRALPGAKVLRALAGPATPPASVATAPRAAAGLQVIDFSLYPDNTAMPPSFAIAGVAFDSLDSAGGLMVNETAASAALQFRAPGLRVTLRRAVDSVFLTAGGFAGTVKIAAFDAAGTQIQSQVISPANVFVRVLLHAQQTKYLELTGGGDEGMLLELVIPD